MKSFPDTMNRPFVCCKVFLVLERFNTLVTSKFLSRFKTCFLVGENSSMDIVWRNQFDGQMIAVGIVDLVNRSRYFVTSALPERSSARQTASDEHQKKVPVRRAGFH